MSNIVFALGFMAVSLIIALYLATQSERPKSFIYAVGLGSMLAQILMLFVVLRLLGLPLTATAGLPSLGASCGSLSMVAAKSAEPCARAF